MFHTNANIEAPKTKEKIVEIVLISVKPSVGR